MIWTRNLCSHKIEQIMSSDNIESDLYVLDFIETYKHIC